jgi:UDP-glucose 4-epimerase
MATVIGIFEDYYVNNKPIPVVRPGTQTRRFTHISDTVKVCYKAWKYNKCRLFSITNKKSYSILQVAKLFKSKIKFLPPRKGERYASALTNLTSSEKIYRSYGSVDLKDYIKEFIKKAKNEHVI